jgi:cobalt transporter subunit CbtB
MTTTTATVSLTRSKSAMIPAFFALVLGVGVLVLAGHVQAAALHDAAHDVRHATGFPCH